MSLQIERRLSIFILLIFLILLSTIQLASAVMDLFPTEIVFSNNNPVESEIIIINVTINNSGDEDVLNTLVQFLDDGVEVGNTTINITANMNNTTIINWPAEVGNNNILVKIDPNNDIFETNETNNNLSSEININAYSIYHGRTSVSLVIGSTWNDKIVSFGSGNVLNIYVTANGGNIDFSSLQAIGRTVSGSVSNNDFSEIDNLLKMTNFSDNITSTYSIDGILPKETNDFLSYGENISYVPIINSTNDGMFKTGILWDTSDDTNGEFDINDKEDLIFITANHDLQVTEYGVVDYVSKFPALLRNYNLQNLVNIFLEAK
ncbi:MAG: CARDB domain-containing protein [Candidatus Woesearchaeota archaeon]